LLEVKDLQLGKKPDNKLWQPNEQERNLLKRFDDEMNTAIRFRSQYEEQWRENIERYEARPFVYEDGRSGVVLPIVKWIIESKGATEMKAPPSFNYEPLEYEEDMVIARNMDEIVKKHVWNLKYVDLDYKFDILNFEKDIMGNMAQYIGWKTVYRVERNEKMPNKDKKEVEGVSEVDTKKERESKKTEDTEYDIDLPKAEQVLFYDDICVENIYPDDYWLHPLSRTVSDSPYFKWRKRHDYGSFLEYFSDTAIFKNIDKVQKGKWLTVGIDNQVIHKDFLADDSDQVVVFEDWNVMRDEVLMIANGVIIYHGANPYKHKELPFVDYIDRLQFNTYVGEGEPQRIANICDAINAFVNIAIDKEKKAGSGINLLDNSNSEFDDTATILSPNQVTRVSSPKDAFVHVELPGMSGSTDKIISMLMDYLIFATGVDFRQITDMNTSTQATVAAIRREITQGRLNLNVKRNENRGYKRLGWLLMELVQQYYPEPLIKHLAGMEEMSPEQIEALMKEKKVEYRRIRVKGMDFREKPNSKGEYTRESLTMSKKGEEEIGFFQARPAYIKSKGKLTVRVVSESTFAASRELEKANAKDYVEVAGSAMEPGPEGQPKPILSLKYGLQKLVDAYGYDRQKAFDTTGETDQGDQTAQSEAKKLLGGMQPPGAPQEGGGASMQGPVPPTAPPAKLAGATSEPVQKVKAELINAHTP